MWSPPPPTAINREREFLGLGRAEGEELHLRVFVYPWNGGWGLVVKKKKSEIEEDGDEKRAKTRRREEQCVVYFLLSPLPSL